MVSALKDRVGYLDNALKSRIKASIKPSIKPLKGALRAFCCTLQVIIRKRFLACSGLSVPTSVAVVCLVCRSSLILYSMAGILSRVARTEMGPRRLVSRALRLEKKPPERTLLPLESNSQSHPSCSISMILTSVHQSKPITTIVFLFIIVRRSGSPTQSNKS